MDEKKALQILSRNIKKYMDLYHYTMSDLARALGVSPAAVRWWVQGLKYPRVKQIEEMCRIFNCTQADLVSEDPAFRMASKDELLEQVVEKAAQLNDEGKQKVIDYIDDISERFKR